MSEYDVDNIRTCIAKRFFFLASAGMQTTLRITHCVPRNDTTRTRCMRASTTRIYLSLSVSRRYGKTNDKWELISSLSFSHLFCLHLIHVCVAFVGTFVWFCFVCLLFSTMDLLRLWVAAAAAAVRYAARWLQNAAKKLSPFGWRATASAIEAINARWECCDGIASWGLSLVARVIVRQNWTIYVHTIMVFFFWFALVLTVTHCNSHSRVFGWMVTFAVRTPIVEAIDIEWR